MVLEVPHIQEDSLYCGYPFRTGLRSRWWLKPVNERSGERSSSTQDVKAAATWIEESSQIYGTYQLLHPEGNRAFQLARA